MSIKISTNELREKYLDFFESKGHVRIPSAPLVPKDDPTVLFTTAGMHPLVPYLKGQEHPSGKRLTDVQKCLRTTDVDEVGDTTHATVFEMLGNWSLGDYFKSESIEWSWEFLTGQDYLALDPRYLAVSVFAGDGDAPRDEESAALWSAVGVANERIAYLDKKENWWPAGGGQPGPQGPDTEMFYWVGDEAPPKVFDPEDERWVEIWNNVFIQFNQPEEGGLEPLSQQSVDTGMGLERTAMVLNGLSSIYEIDTYAPLMALIDEKTTRPDERNRRILADHIKAFTFVLGDEVAVTPSKTDQGYVARRLVRRAVVAARALKIEEVDKLLTQGLRIVADQYGDTYPSLVERHGEAENALNQEIAKFGSALERGVAKINEIFQNRSDVNGLQAFELVATFGLPIEVVQELASEKGGSVDIGGYQDEMKAHQEKSRTAAAGKFRGGLADHSKESIHYHTATHLLHQALRDVLGDHVLQKGSNITSERLRFDFSHGEKMSPGEVQKVESIVNEQIQAGLPVTREELTVLEAKNKGALGLFEHKYEDKVSVYSMGDYSCEICGGPHVENTGELGMFRIAKEESAGSGVRRIKAVFADS